MNLIPTGATARTMTSRELAALAEKRHDNVMRVCRDLRDTGVCPQIEETPYIYLCGPMTGLPEYNYPAFHAAAAELRAQGWRVVNPAENAEPTADPTWDDRD